MHTENHDRVGDHEPRIYALASSPTTPGQAETSNWSLELHIPAESRISRPPSPSTTPSTKHKHSFLSGWSQKHKDKPATEPRSKPAQPAQHHYFTCDSSTPISTRPADTILRIRLPPLLPLSGTETPKSLVDQVLQSIPQPIANNSSQLWLPRALRVLQMRDILPPADRGFDVSKFISFAGSYVERTIHGKGTHSHLFSATNTPAGSRPGSRVVSRAPSPVRAGTHNHDLIHHLHSHALAQTHAAEDQPAIDGVVDSGSREEDSAVEEVDYLAVLRQNARLKRMLSSNNTDYAVVNGADELDELEEDEYGSPKKAEGKPVKKGWGGFWFTYGSGKSSPRNRSAERGREFWMRRDDAYGGLM